jgi:(p)ppGpp synthase/HD superfamily hydrolase
MIDPLKAQSMLEIVQKYHASQWRNNGRIPYWHHCLSTAEIVYDAICRSNEFEDSSIVTDIFLSALAHDLYEDTPIDPAEIRIRFGARVDDWVRYLTNEEGDDFRENYIRKIASSPEEVKLIKLADVTDNTASCAYGLHDLGVAWVMEQYMPHLVEMRNVITADCFQRYTRTASILIQNLQFACERLESNLKKW